MTSLGSVLESTSRHSERELTGTKIPTPTHKNKGSTIGLPKTTRKCGANVMRGRCGTATRAQIQPSYRPDLDFLRADDGIRTRDPHLGNELALELPTCTFTDSRSMIGAFG